MENLCCFASSGRETEASENGTETEARGCVTQTWTSEAGREALGPEHRSGGPGAEPERKAEPPGRGGPSLPTFSLFLELAELFPCIPSFFSGLSGS